MEDALKELVVKRGHLMEDVTLGKVHIAKGELPKEQLRGWKARIDSANEQIKELDALLLSLSAPTN